MEDNLSESRRACLASIERLSKVVEDELKRVRYSSANDGDIIDLEALQWRVLKLWKSAVGAIRVRKPVGQDRKRWIERKGTMSPQEGTMEKGK